MEWLNFYLNFFLLLVIKNHPMDVCAIKKKREEKAEFEKKVTIKINKL